jgi:hypothetical protein
LRGIVADQSYAAISVHVDPVRSSFCKFLKVDNIIIAFAMRSGHKSAEFGNIENESPLIEPSLFIVSGK